MTAKILVADESPTIHKIVAMAFENEGITVEGISRGDHVLDYMWEFQPDIVLTDVHLPGINGYELCRQIKNSPSFRSVRVILLTSDFEDLDKAKLEDSQANDFISKPFKTEEILKKVKSQLKASATEKETPAKKPESSQKTENNKVVQSEFEDIVNQPKESTGDPLKQLFSEEKDSNSSTAEIELESEPSQESNVDESREEKSPTAETTGKNKKPTDPETDKVTPEIFLDISEEDCRAETRPVKVNTNELSSAFQSVLAAPKPDPDDADKSAVPREPGTKPDLIEETLAFMSGHTAGKNPETEPKKESTGTMDTTDPSLAERIVEEHMGYIASQIPEDARHDTPASFEKTVRDVLGEVAPKIIRQVIQEEIETIKKMKEA